MPSPPGQSVEAFRMRRPLRSGGMRAPAAAILGEGPVAAETARRLRAARPGRLVMPFDAQGPVDVLVVCDPRPAVIADAALWAARVCPFTVIVIAARGGLELCARALRASGLAPGLIMSTGAMPRALSEAATLARSLDVCVSQVCVCAIGGDSVADTRVLDRYTAVAGIPATQMTPQPASRPPAREASDADLGRSAAALAIAVLQDRRQVFCCGAWVEGAFGLPGGYVSVPVRVGARGAEEPIPLRLTLDERAVLQRSLRD